MGCDCNKSTSRFLNVPRPTQQSNQQTSKAKKKSCPKCYTYNVRVGSGVVRCPICTTVFAA